MDLLPAAQGGCTLMAMVTRAARDKARAYAYDERYRLDPAFRAQQDAIHAAQEAERVRLNGLRWITQALATAGRAYATNPGLLAVLEELYGPGYTTEAP
jgi:hypothetical protein